MENQERKQQLLDAIADNPSAAFPGFDWQPNTYAVDRYGTFTSSVHVNEYTVYGKESSDHNRRQTYIKDGKTDKNAIIVDVNGTAIEVLRAWELLHGEKYPNCPDLFNLYNIEPPQRDPVQVKIEQERKSQTDKLLSDIRADYLGAVGQPVRDYLQRPIDQGGRGWDADTVTAMGEYIGVVTPSTFQRLTQLTGQVFPTTTPTTHPIVIYTFTKDGRLQYLKFRCIGSDKTGGSKWANPSKEQSGVGRDNVDPFNYNRVSFLATPGLRTLVVMESELCAAHATVAGIKNVIALRGSDGIKPSFAKRISRAGCNKVVFLYDTETDEKKKKDIHGKITRAITGLREVAANIHIRVATIPEELNAKDPDELLSKYSNGAKLLQDIVDRAPSAARWEGENYAIQYADAPDDDARETILKDVVDRAAKLKELRGMASLSGDELLATFADKSGAPVTNETLTRAAQQIAQDAATEKYNKQRDVLLNQYDAERTQGNNTAAMGIIRELATMQPPQDDPELTQQGKTIDDIARELYVDETATLATSYTLNTYNEYSKSYVSQPVVLPANGITYFAGGTGHGKSTMLQNIAANLLHQGKRVLYYGFEEQKRDTLLEFVNIYVHQHVPEVLELSTQGSAEGINKYLKTKDPNVFNGHEYDGGYNEISDANKQRVAEAIHGFFRDFRGMNGGRTLLYVYDDALTSGQLVDHIARVAPIIKPDAIFIDYIQYLQSQEDAASAQWEDLGRVSKDLITINKTHNVPVVAAAQLKEKNNVKSDNYPDKLNYNDIFGASSIAQGAAAVYVVAKATRYPDECTVKYCGKDNHPFGGTLGLWVKLVKNRFGQDGGMAIYTFDGSRRYIDPQSIAAADDYSRTVAQAVKDDRQGGKSKLNNEDVPF